MSESVAHEAGAHKRVELGPWIVRLIFLGIGIAVLVGSIGYGLETADGLVGPGMVPFLASVVMVLATLVECLNALRKQRAGAEGTEEANAIADADDVDNLGRTAAQRNRAVVLVFGAILLTVLLTRIIGLLISLSLMVFGLIAFVERKPWWIALIAGVGSFVFGWVVFGLVLNVPLPTGMLGLI
ncbi:tripartite tricarboxylate transporter TctB family protein [Propionimicrobium sp. PCR01-08-3]|uniref:tripartite tricarboxylate transporter TctB family protein n=1 Tax=Propionimicrobium sp. PCR01-08-3 TaxID=3052086 RepID=UPI00255C4BA1|nr:tripartite tricarboxylate transporter TctB family protein [Propionimicrobium sp. PCR01-08-3]WIY82802.1 tripartite tricarboxylate transporter TctB family protein [Propionimicrobium sp. PCR01-08-3]